MQTPDPNTITRLLGEVRAGQSGAVSTLLPLVYDELEGIAAVLFAGERHGHTLQPTALINEAWLKLAGHLDGIEDRVHFFAVASTAMRQVLLDHARRIARDKRGGGNQKLTLDQPFESDSKSGLDLIDLEDSLERLAALNGRHARMIELRVFGGLTISETATALGVSRATVERDWFAVRAWVRNELSR